MIYGSRYNMDLGLTPYLFTFFSRLTPLALLLQKPNFLGSKMLVKNTFLFNTQTQTKSAGPVLLSIQLVKKQATRGLENKKHGNRQARTYYWSVNKRGTIDWVSNLIGWPGAHYLSLLITTYHYLSLHYLSLLITTYHYLSLLIATYHYLSLLITTYHYLSPTTGMHIKTIVWIKQCRSDMLILLNWQVNYLQLYTYHIDG